MAIGIDTSKWKPRKIKGTPAAKVRNILGIGIITIGMFTGALFHFSKITVGIRSAAEKLYEDPIEEVERHSPSDSKNSSSCEVTSKYFVSKGGMDESLSEFQEKKKLACAKKTEKPSTSKAKPKKIKKIRGQKDISSVLKKKNELIAYYNDFDKVCKQSGIDVDSEQLQLAIALSKSLQETDSKSEEEPSKPLTTQERTGKIRTTLQEYGFVVPDIKVTAKKSRKTKKYKKNYKLLLTTEAEKQQIISDKYSQVLFQNLDKSKDSVCAFETNVSTAPLYHIGTNISYEELKDNSLLYVEDLLEKSPSFVGCLLKDWSQIPGRPLSPTLEPSHIKFEKVNCTQDELDIVLSGPTEVAQNIVRNKHIEEPVVAINKSQNCAEVTEQHKMDVDCIEIVDEVEPNNLAASKEQLEDKDVENLLTVTQKVRSCSPDIFDDEVSEILDISNQSVKVTSQELPTIDKTKQFTQIMDLTECVNINFQTSIIKPLPQMPLSQGNQTIKRKSNDFMDITECVVGSSQPIRENPVIEENIDLTQSPITEENVGSTQDPITDENVDLTQNSEEQNVDLTQNSDEQNVPVTETTTKIQEIQRMDLTQSSDTNEELPEVQISGNKSLDDTIILNEEAYTAQLETEIDFLGVKKLIVASDKDINNKTAIFSEKLISTSNGLPQNTASITIDSEDEIDSHLNIQNEGLGKPISPIECIENHDLDSSQKVINKSADEFNTSEDYPKSTRNSEHIGAKSKTESFFEEFVHRHSESTGDKDTSNDILCVDEASNNSASDVNSINKKDSVDLTQGTDTSEEIATPTKNDDIPKTSYGQGPSDSNNLGKIGDVSIDYDELFDDLQKSHSPMKSISSRSHTTEFNSESNVEKPSTSDLVPNSSQNSEAFEISDKELDYSINKSRLEYPKDNYDFGGISIVDNLPDLPSFRPSTNNFENRSFNRSLSESYLPAVQVKDNIEKENKSKSNTTSPTSSKTPKQHIIAKTPKNGEYIVKTDNVTPMVDYNKLSTPEMNAELNKYGLRPFKRKRAIQLLTHLYNQTHPVVESLEIDPSCSPSKRFKRTTIPENSPTKRSPTKISKSQKIISPTKRKSPKKISKALNKESKTDTADIEDDENGQEMAVTGKENDIYAVTNEVPEIRDIECCEEDWVFQKREKAKLHSCRVPLHIAFHNYVSSRQKLREAILRYEPVNIDDIHRGLVGNGCRYDPKDLLKFLDKKCITVKTADNNGRNKKHY
ncbi:slx4 endonuclease domain-containing protein [Phthorimaea operculella]|nr:slx4 endonuclease domain-containing protein [Phthorimaea operculella]